MRKTLKMSPVRPERKGGVVSSLPPPTRNPLKLTLNRVVEGKNVDALSVLDVMASVDGGDVTELHTEVVASDYDGRKQSALRRPRAAKKGGQLTLVDLDLALVDILGGEDDENCDG